MCCEPQEGAGHCTRCLFKCVLGIKGHKYSSHNLQLHFSNGTQEIALRSLLSFCRCDGHLIVFLPLITSLLYERSIPLLFTVLSLLSASVLFPHLTVCLSFIHLSAIQLMGTESPLETLLGTRDAHWTR